MEDYKALNHCKYDCYYHIILLPKYRRKIMVGKFKEDLYSYIREISSNHSIDLLEINGTEDHIHLLLGFPPTMSLSKVLEIIKSNSSRLAFLDHLRYLRKFYWYTNHMWSRSYFVSTVGNNFDIVTKYIRSQS